jgi:hypothetical protein
MNRAGISDSSVREPQRLRLLRVLRVAAAVARYCARNAVGLFRLVWLPCLLVLASQIVLDWLVLTYPPKLPAWLLTQNFKPRTWLTAAAIAPWGAMAWTSVLGEMSGRKASHGAKTAHTPRPSRVRLESIVAIVLATLIFTAVNLLDGGLRVLQTGLLAALYERFSPSDNMLNIVGWSSEVLHVVVMAAVVAASYLSIGHLLRSGTLNPVRVWRLTRGNRLRLFALFLLLSVAAIALDVAASPAVGWLLRTFADELFWTLKGAFVRQLVDIPFFLLWTVVYAVTVGIVLEVLEQARASGGVGTSQPARRALGADRLDPIDSAKRRPN